MMRTACPICGTVFRVTPEQLRVRAGKVRCGQCQAIFNALESLIDEPLPSVVGGPTTEPPVPAPLTADLPAAAAALPPAPEPAPDAPLEGAADASPAHAAVEEPPRAAEVPAVPAAEALPEPPAEHPAEEESPEESAQAAREAGLAAAREMAEAPGYNRWAAGTLASDPIAGLALDPPRRSVWPYVLAALLLLVALAAQVAHHWRTEIVQRFPVALDAYDAAGIAVPLPQVADLVSIEASDLQADNTRGLLVLAATLRNRAAYPQSWPLLELTLTDAQDAVVARRVLAAADYLPPRTDPGVFPPGADTAVKLWIDARDAGAAGYRLYVFYP